MCSKVRLFTCIFIQIAVRQQKQVQERGNCWNCKGFESTGCIDDRYFASLKAAGTNDPSMQKACSAPAIQAKMNTLSPAQLQFDEKLDRLKKVLPFVSEVKLASLLTRENGNMNSVVQQILDSGTNENADKEVDGTTRVIDLTDKESAKNDSAATQVQNLAKIPVDTNMLQKILETVEKQGISFSMQQFVVFSKTKKRAKFLCTVVGFQMKMKIQQGSLTQQPLLGSMNVHIVSSQQSNWALSVIFVETFLIRIFTDGECVDLI